MQLSYIIKTSYDLSTFIDSTSTAWTQAHTHQSLMYVIYLRYARVYFLINLIYMKAAFIYTGVYPCEEKKEVIQLLIKI